MPEPTRYTHRLMSGRRARSCAAVLLLAVVCCGGCQRALFPKNLPRTQFDTYDRMRNRYTPLEEPDVFGNPQPALRARLGKSY